MKRFGLRDDQWDRIKDILRRREGHVGGTTPDNRLFVDAILYRFRSSIPWRDLPAALWLLEERGSAFQLLGKELSF